MALFSLFKNSVNVDQFEKELNELTLAINKSQQAIIKLERFQASFIKSLLVYFIGLYLGYVAYLYIELPFNSFGINRLRFFFGNQLKTSILVLFGAPVTVHLGILFIKYIIGWLIGSKRQTITKQKKKQRQKINELKEFTNYTTTNELVSKFDKSSNPLPSVKAPNPNQTTKSKQTTTSKQTTKQRNQSRESTQGLSKGQPPMIQSPKTFQDRLLDILIGSEDDTQKYALICKNCFNHCGLAPPSEPYTKFICPFCKTLNDPEKSAVSSKANSPIPVETPTFRPDTPKMDTPKIDKPEKETSEMKHNET